jgi:hypothetical protein
MKKSFPASSGFTTFGTAKRLKKRARDGCCPESGIAFFKLSVNVSGRDV